jgi:hypothetical protein
MDLYARAEQRAKRTSYAANLVAPIEHDNTEFVRFQSEKDIAVSNANNRSYIACRTGDVNPHGYGQDVFRIFRGSGNRLPPIVWARRQRIVRPIRRRVVAN